jgi:hypothetical protein
LSRGIFIAQIAAHQQRRPAEARKKYF